MACVDHECSGAEEMSPELHAAEASDEEADYGEDERDDEADVEEEVLEITGDASNSAAACAAASDSTAPPPDCSEVPVEVEQAANDFHTGGSCSSTAAAPIAVENCDPPEESVPSVGAERLRETARPLAPLQRPEQSNGSVVPSPPSPPWQPPWRLGQAPWQRSPEPSKVGRPKMAPYSASRGPWARKQHQPPYAMHHVPKNGVFTRPPFAPAPKLTARPPPPSSRAGPYGWQAEPARPFCTEECTPRLYARSRSRSPEKVPHKAAPKSMKMRLAKAKSGQPQAAPKSSPAAAASAPWARPVQIEAPAASSTQSPPRARSRSPRLDASSAGHSASDNCYEVSLSSEEEELEREEDKRKGGSAAEQRDNISELSDNVVPPDKDGQENSQGRPGKLGQEEDTEPKSADRAAAWRKDLEDLDEDDCAEIDLAQGQVELTAYEAEAEADVLQEDLAEGWEAYAELPQEIEAVHIDAAEAEVADAEFVEEHEATKAAAEAAEADSVEADAAEIDAQNLDMPYPPDWLVAEGALDPVPERQESEDGADKYQDHADEMFEQVDTSGVADEPAVEVADTEFEDEAEAPQLQPMAAHQVEEVVEIEDDDEEAEEEEEEEEEAEVQFEQEEEEEGVPEVNEHRIQEQQEDDDDDDRMDVEAEALLRAQAQRMARSMVGGMEDENCEEFFVDVAGSDAQDANVPVNLQQNSEVATATPPAMKPLTPAETRPGRQVDVQKLPRPAQKVAPWNRPRPPSFRGVSGSAAHRH